MESNKIGLILKWKRSSHKFLLRLYWLVDVKIADKLVKHKNEVKFLS